ncbi:MAG TPA: group 1 glycosyl transferase, partial [Brevibacterium sp.]|nr:group 1 glycosyl transferase [Brevibacterium sp.]
MLEDHGQPGPTGLDPAARILHVVTTTRGVIGEVAVDAIRGHLTAGRQVALAARPSVIRRLDLPESRDLATIPIGARDRVTGADPGSSLTLHQHYRHVDVV